MIGLGLLGRLCQGSRDPGKLPTETGTRLRSLLLCVLASGELAVCPRG